MPLTTGSRLGPYEIVSPLGAGGMGEVYRARDTKLNRDVAIKVLPEVFSKDPERLARFEREAQVLASLNHPNIAHIHGLEESSDGPALVMELVEGETLAERIQGLRAKGSGLPIDEALPIARQIADALDAAHSQGIVHRDLKPANIKLRPDGTVKVLDFGLAKLKAGDTTSGVRLQPDLTPTLTTPAGTLAGAILGTAAYMAPEQARGKAVDKRADVWAFGCVLFEMLTGTRAFGGDELTDTLAFIITRDPNWSVLPADTSAPIRRLLRRCLEKDAQKRLHDIADARIEIDEAIAGGEAVTAAPMTGTKGRERLAWSVAATLGLLLVGSAVAVLSLRSAPAPEVTRLDVATPPSSDPISFAVSPDGRQLAFVANADGGPKLWIRRLDQADAQALAGTESATLPFWSPDSRAIGFFTSGKLKRIDLSGTGLTALTDAPSARGGTWNSDGVIVFAPSTTSGLMRIPAAGGEAVALTKLGNTEGSHRFPQFLPDGRHFLFAMALGAPSTRGVYVTSLDGGSPRRVMDNDTTAVFARPDWLLYVNQGTLVARHFDPARLLVSGDPVVIDRNVGADTAIVLGAFSVSAHVLAHRSTTGVRRQLVWMDRAGRVLTTLGAPDDASTASPELSADDRRVAVSRNTQGSNDIWIIDVARAFGTRFTFDPSADTLPVWTPDGGRVVFRSTRSGGGDLFERPTSAAANEQPLLATSDSKWPVDVSRDGRLLLFVTQRPKTGADLFALPLTGEKKPFPVVQTNFDEVEGQFSPDGRWLCYTSNESGRQEVYVQPFPGPGEKVQVSTAGGGHPRWRRDGKELFSVAPDGSLMAASVNTRPGGTLDVAAPTRLFAPHWAAGSNIFTSGGAQRPQYAAAVDGRFLVNVSVDEASLKPITVVLNWQSALKK